MITRAHSIIGAVNSYGGRVHGDHYPTPLPAIEKLLEKENFRGTIWEPACGEGNISTVLTDNGFRVYSSDLYDYKFGRIYDFLNSPKSANYEIVDNIITNPPFNLALEFINKAKLFSRDKIAFLLKTQFLEGARRYEMYQDRTFPLKVIYQFTRRISFPTVNSTNGGMLAFAWFVWEREYREKPYVDWIL